MYIFNLAGSQYQLSLQDGIYMSAGRNSLIYIAFSILQKAISFVLLPVLTYFITKDGLGKITLLTTLVPMFAIYSSLVLYGAGTVFTYKFDNEDRIKQLWGNINLVSNCFGCVFFLIMLALFNTLQSDLFEGLLYKDYLILLLLVFFNSIYNQYQAYLQAMKKVKEFTKNAITFTMINVFLILIAVTQLKLGYRGYYYAYAITSAIFYIYAMWHALRNFIFKVDFKLIKDCLKYSIPLIPHVTFGFFLAYTDRIFVNKYLGTSELGVYGVACQFAVIFGMITSGFISAYSPFSFEKIKIGDFASITQFCYKSLVLFSMVVLLMSFFAHDLLHLIVNENFVSGWIVLPVFASAYMLQLSYVFFVTVLFYKKPILVNVVTFFSGGLNVVLNIYLTKKFGIVGATMCTLISYLVSMIIVFIISKKLLDLGFNFFNILFYQALIIMFASSAYLIAYIPYGYLYYLLEISCAVISIGVCLFFANILFHVSFWSQFVQMYKKVFRI